MKYLAYMIYGGTIVTPLSTWHDTKAKAMDQAAGNVKADFHQFIGVVTNNESSVLGDYIAHKINQQHAQYGDQHR